MTDKEKIKAEIKRYKHKADERLKIKGRTIAEDSKDIALQNLCGNLLHFIDSLPEEPVSEDLKDMPKWERATENLQIGCLVWDELRNIHLYMDRVSKGELYISMADILRLPGSPKEGEE